MMRLKITGLRPWVKVVIAGLLEASKGTPVSLKIAVLSQKKSQAKVDRSRIDNRHECKRKALLGAFGAHRARS